MSKHKLTHGSAAGRSYISSRALARAWLRKHPGAPLEDGRVFLSALVAAIGDKVRAGAKGRDAVRECVRDAQARGEL